MICAPLLNSINMIEQLCKFSNNPVLGANGDEPCNFNFDFEKLSSSYMKFCLRVFLCIGDLHISKYGHVFPPHILLRCQRSL